MIRRLRAGAAFLLALAALLSATGASADEMRPGYLEFAQRDSERWTLVLKLPVGGTILPDARPIIPRSCAIAGEPKRELADAALLSRFEVRCRGNVAGQRIGLGGLDAVRGDVLVRVAPEGRPVQAMRLTQAQPTAEIRAVPGTMQVAWTYFATGVEHILFGYDHLLFVVALVLLLSGAWTIAKAVTAFTLAHSITLAGTTLGLFGLPQAPVEALIALSIVFLAVEIAKRSPDRQGLAERAPWIVAFVFGLLHGFGFAGALREIGLPEGDVPLALLSFNLGVEAGQLLIVAASLAAMATLRRVCAAAPAPAAKLASYGIGMTASYWLIERLL